MINLFMNRRQIRLPNSEPTDLDWYFLRLYQKLKFLIRDLLSIPFVTSAPLRVLLIYSLYSFYLMAQLKQNWQEFVKSPIAGTGEVCM